MLLSSTARRRPSLSDGDVENSASARPLAISRRPSVSVSRIGSATALMIASSSERSLRNLLCPSASTSRVRSACNFWLMTPAAQTTSADGALFKTTSSSPSAGWPAPGTPSGIAQNGERPNGAAASSRALTPLSEAPLHIVGSGVRMARING